MNRGGGMRVTQAAGEWQRPVDASSWQLGCNLVALFGAGWCGAVRQLLGCLLGWLRGLPAWLLEGANGNVAWLVSRFICYISVVDERG